MDHSRFVGHRKRPDRLPVLIAAHRAELAKARKHYRGPIVLIGKSMRSRVGCHVALETGVSNRMFGISTLRNGRPRQNVLLKLKAPVLFVQGSRDQLCPLDLLESVRARMTAVTSLEIISNGDHSLTVTRRRLSASGENQNQVDGRVLKRIADFVKIPKR